jgi:hypothetical protein
MIGNSNYTPKIKEIIPCEGYIYSRWFNTEPVKRVKSQETASIKNKLNNIIALCYKGEETIIP